MVCYTAVTANVRTACPSLKTWQVKHAAAVMLFGAGRKGLNENLHDMEVLLVLDDIGEEGDGFLQRIFDIHVLGDSHCRRGWTYAVSLGTG